MILNLPLQMPKVKRVLAYVLLLTARIQSSPLLIRLLARLFTTLQLIMGLFLALCNEQTTFH